MRRCINVMCLLGKGTQGGIIAGSHVRLQNCVLVWTDRDVRFQSRVRPNSRCNVPGLVFAHPMKYTKAESR